MDSLSTSRRELLTGLALSAAGAPVAARPASRVKAIAFDAFVLFDPATITRRATDILGDKANALVASASAKLFAYTWLYTSASRYVGFETLARDALRFAAAQTRLTLSSEQLDQLVAGYSALEMWPDVPAALEELRHRGVRLALLSNLPARALDSSLHTNGIGHLIHHILSTDRVRNYKPAPQANAMATSTFGVGRKYLGESAKASLEAEWADWFGYRTAWVNRMHLPPEQPHVAPHIVSGGMEGVRALVG